MKPTKLATVTLSLALLAATPRVARGEGNVEQAKTQFTLGAQAYTAAKYDVAVTAFEEAYRLLPRPEILFSLAQAEKKQCVAVKDATLLKKALAHYRQYYALDLPQNSRKTEAVESIQYLEQLATQPEYGGGQPAVAQKSPTKLAVFSSADGAHVYIDGRSQGDVPFVGPVSPGKHTVLVRLEGFTDASREVLVPEGTTQTIPMPLTERAVGVAFDTSPGADVYVDGRFMGRTPFPVEGAPLSPGNHVVVVVKNGRRLATKDIKVERSRPIVVRMPLETSTQRVASYVVGGLGLAAVVGAGAFYAVAAAEQARAENRLDQQDAGTLDVGGLRQYTQAATNRDAFRAAGTITGIAGLTVFTGAVLLFAFDTPDPKSVPLRGTDEPKAKPKGDFDVSIAPSFGPMNGAFVTGRF